MSSNPPLSTGEVAASIAVRDLSAAARFYEDVLGLQRLDGNSEVNIYASGGSRLFVYRSPYAGTNKATAAYWVGGDVDGVARTLKDRGVTFERYDLPGLRLEGDVYVGGNVRTFWFKDPDGNILSVVNDANPSK